MTGTLSHTQSQLVTRADLLAIAPPPATATWKPIAHGDLIHALDRQLLVRGITIKKEQFALQREGARLFAVLDLACEETEEFCAAMGIRTSNDRSMALEIAVGVKHLRRPADPDPPGATPVMTRYLPRQQGAHDRLSVPWRPR